jgi:hypothetical protein
MSKQEIQCLAWASLHLWMASATKSG